MRRLPAVLLAALLAALATTRASAQTPAARSLRLERPAVSVLPVRAEGLAEPTGRPRPQILPGSSGSDKRTGRALMIVGAAGIVTGIIVDESIVTIAGAGVGGYGLFLYLR
jgi:hypothetical protein